MKTLNDIYTEIAADNDKLAQFNAIKTSDELVKFAASFGVTATAVEIMEFINSKNKSELTDNELEQVAGGAEKPEAKCPSCGSTSVGQTINMNADGIVDNTCKCNSCGYTWAAE